MKAAEETISSTVRGNQFHFERSSEWSRFIFIKPRCTEVASVQIKLNHGSVPVHFERLTPVTGSYSCWKKENQRRLTATETERAGEADRSAESCQLFSERMRKETTGQQNI